MLLKLNEEDIEIIKNAFYTLISKKMMIGKEYEFITDFPDKYKIMNPSRRRTDINKSD